MQNELKFFFFVVNIFILMVCMLTLCFDQKIIMQKALKYLWIKGQGVNKVLSSDLGMRNQWGHVLVIVIWERVNRSSVNYCCGVSRDRKLYKKKTLKLVLCITLKCAVVWPTIPRDLASGVQSGWTPRAHTRCELWPVKHHVDNSLHCVTA